MRAIKRPANIETSMNLLKKEAHERVVERGLVQFRLDEQYMKELLELADKKGVGYGVLARIMVCDHLEQERTKTPKQPLSSIRQLVKQEIKEALKTLPVKRKRAV